jgi:Flp pilus assembly protein CpaB
MAGIGTLATDVVHDGNGADERAGPRVLERRRSLPNSRAIAGGLLVAVAAVGLFAAYADVHAGSRRRYVVARHALTPGSRLQPSDLAVEAMDLPSTARQRAFSSISDVEGATLVAPLEEGELVQASAVVATRPGAGAREVSFPVERGHLGPLRNSERVDVVATFGTGPEAVTTVVLRQALVLQVDRGGSALGDGGSTVVTVAVDNPTDEVAVAHAVSLGKITLVRATAASPANGPPPTYRTAPQGGDTRGGSS